MITSSIVKHNKSLFQVTFQLTNTGDICMEDVSLKKAFLKKGLNPIFLV